MLIPRNHQTKDAPHLSVTLLCERNMFYAATKASILLLMKCHIACRSDDLKTLFEANLTTVPFSLTLGHEFAFSANFYGSLFKN